MRPHNKNTPQIAVALLRDRTKLVFAASRILSRDEPNPGGKITPRAECLSVCDSGGNSTRANDADPVDARQSLARLIGAMLHNEPLLDRANHRMQRLQLRCQYDQARTGINGQTFIALVRSAPSSARLRSSVSSTDPRSMISTESTGRVTICPRNSPITSAAFSVVVAITNLMTS